MSSSSYKISGQPGDSHFELQSNTTELILRLPTSADISTVLDILSNKANTEFDKSVSEVSTEDLKEIARKWTTVSEPLTHLNFRLSELPGLAGSVTSMNINREVMDPGLVQRG